MAQNKLIIILIVLCLHSVIVYGQASKNTEIQVCEDIEIKFTKIGLGIGISWGEVKLINSHNLSNITYFDILGISLVEGGISWLTADGKICLPNKSNAETNDFNARELGKFEGIYSGIGLGISIVAGFGVWKYVNQQGAIITISGFSQGLNIGIPFQTITLSLK